MIVSRFSPPVADGRQKIGESKEVDSQRSGALTSEHLKLGTTGPRSCAAGNEKPPPDRLIPPVRALVLGGRRRKYFRHGKRSERRRHSPCRSDRHQPGQRR